MKSSYHFLLLTSAPRWVLSYINTHTYVIMHTQQDSMWAPFDLHVLNWHTYILVIGSTIFPLPAAPCVVPAWLDVREMEHPHGACDTAALCFSPSGQDQRRLTGRLHINWNRCSDREALFFFIGSSGNHKANILLRTVFGVPCEQTERGNGSTSSHRGR